MQLLLSPPTNLVQFNSNETSSVLRINGKAAGQMN